MDFQKKQLSTESSSPPPARNWLNSYVRLIDKTLGLTVSVSLHLLVIAILSFIVFYAPKNESDYARAGITELDIPKLNITLEEPSRRTEDEKSSESQATPNAAAGSAPVLTELQLQSPPAAFFESAPAAAATGFGDGFSRLANSAIASEIHAGGPYAGRGKGSGQGGIPIHRQADAMVVKALDFLKQSQNSDGSWGNQANRDFADAVSSLAILTLLAHGEDTATPKYGNTVRKGLRYLLRSADGADKRPDGFGDALLTYALAEAAAVTQIPELCHVAGQRLQRIQRRVSNQDDAWRAGKLSPWNYQALKAGTVALHSRELAFFAREAARSFLQHHRTQSALLRKDSPRSDMLDVFARTYCLQIMGLGAHQAVRKSLDRAIDYNRKALLQCDWNERQEWPLYHWYYRANALYGDSRGQGAVWERWFREMVRMLATQQQRDGSFISPENAAPYNQSGENVRTFQSRENLVIYSTALCALILQTPNRYSAVYFEAPPVEMPVSPEVAAGREIGTAAALKDMVK